MLAKEPDLIVDPVSLAIHIRSTIRRDMAVTIAAELAGRFSADPPKKLAKTAVDLTDAILAELLM